MIFCMIDVNANLWIWTLCDLIVPLSARMCLLLLKLYMSHVNRDSLMIHNIKTRQCHYWETYHKMFPESLRTAVSYLFHITSLTYLIDAYVKDWAFWMFFVLFDHIWVRVLLSFGLCLNVLLCALLLLQWYVILPCTVLHAFRVLIQYKVQSLHL